MIVIGLTGTLGSGKGVVKDILSKKLGYEVVTLSEIIKEELKKRGKEVTRKNLQDMGNELRKRFGNDILVKLALKKCKGKNLIIDGIRNVDEINHLRKKFGKKFLLIGIDAPLEIRFKRIRKRGRKGDPKTWKEFIKADERDRKEKKTYGQQVEKCLGKADFLLINDCSLKELEKLIEELIENFKIYLG